MALVAVAVEDETDYRTSERVIETAMSLALQGKMTAADVIAMGCMTPGCLTSSTLRKVARAAGVPASSLIG
jgi:hypothetical protein